MTESAQPQPVKPKSRELLKKLGFVVLALGIWLMLWVQIQNARAQQSLKWPKTTGRITFSGQMHGHKFGVNYAYEVNQTPYSHNVVSFRAGPDADVNDMQRYPIRRGVDVYYNPVNPGDSCLEPGFPTAPINYNGFAISLSFILILFSSFLFVWSAIWKRLLPWYRAGGWRKKPAPAGAAAAEPPELKTEPISVDVSTLESSTEPISVELLETRPEPISVNVPDPELEPISVDVPHPEPEPISVDVPHPELEPISVDVPDPDPEPISVDVPHPKPEPRPVEAELVPALEEPAPEPEEPVAVQEAVPAPNDSGPTPEEQAAPTEEP